MYTNFIQNYLQGAGDGVIEDALTQWEQDEQDRYNDLIDFIDEFVSSKEYEEYLDSKRKIIKITGSTQYSETDFLKYNETKINAEKEYPLTEYSKHMFEFIRRFRNYLNNKKNAEMLQKQIKGIQMIRDKIAAFKKFTLLNADVINRRREKELNELIEEFCETFSVDWSKVGTKSKKTNEKVATFSKMLRKKYMNRKNKYALIVKTINDEIRKERKMTIPKLRFSHKIKTGKSTSVQKTSLAPSATETVESLKIPTQIDLNEIEKEPLVRISSVETINKEISPSFISTGHSKKQKRDSKSKTPSTPIETQNIETLDTTSQIPPKQIQKDEWSRIPSIINTEKSPSIVSTSPSRKTKDDTKSRKGKEPTFSIPTPRLKNTRKKITGDGIQSMSDLITEFKQFDEIMEMQYMIRNPEKSKKYELDKYFLCKPKTVIFKNYEAGKTYKRMLKIQNISLEIRKFRFIRIICEDAYDALLFRLWPLFNIHKIISGGSITMFLTFTPEIEIAGLEAKLEFLSFDKKTQTNQKFFVNVKCEARLIDFKISSNDIYFGQVHMWQKKSGFKTIRLANDGSLPCTATIKKVQDPLEIEDIISQYGEEQPLLKVIQEILDDIFDNLFNYFAFDKTYIDLPKASSCTLKIYMKNFDHYGDYIEKYIVEVFDSNDKSIGSHEVMLHGEVIAHFIRTIPEELDFGVCMINSVYQTELNIENTSTSTQAVTVKYPSAMIEHVKPNISNVFLPPGSKRTIWIKLFPRRTIINCSFFDPKYSILEFPIHICILTNNHTDVATVKTMVYALITTSKALNLSPTNNIATRYCKDGVFLNLGDCSIFETVISDIVLENNSLSPQIYGFLDLPKCLTICPNYGFGIIPAGITQVLKLHFHPDYQDLLKKFNAEKCKNFTVKYKINIDTLCNIRQLKKAIDYKKLRKSIDLILKEIRKYENKQLQEDIEYCKQIIKTELYPESKLSHPEQTLRGEQSIELNCNSTIPSKVPEEGSEESTHEKYHYTTETNLEMNHTCITIEANIIKPLVEVSAQYLILPDTPCSSYSYVEFEIRALRMEFNEETPFLKNKDLKLPKYEAWFKITEDNDQIRVEPSCGILKNGEIRKIFVIAKPTPPESLVEELAKSIKYAEIYKIKIKEFEEHISVKQKSSVRDKADDKKDEKSSLKTKKDLSNIQQQTSRKITKDILREGDMDSKIKISESELVVSSQDYFPAEMCYWRSLEPYIISSKLTCIVNYESAHMQRQKERIFINVECKVVKPDFIINETKSQRFSFDKVVIGMRGVQYIVVQNIKYDAITLKVSALDPLGPLRIPYLKSYVIPPECYLKLPIYFEPTEVDQKVEEYFEISSGRTVVPLIIQGIGVKCEITFNPNVSICRLTEATQKKCEECPIKINNSSEGPVIVTIEKVFEIEGTLTSFPSIDEEKSVRNINLSKSKEKNEKKSKSDMGSSKKFGNELTSSEISSFNDFYPSTESHFLILNESETITLEPNSVAVITIGFGRQAILAQRKDELINKVKPRKDSTVVKGIVTEKLYYVAKYNFRVRNTFIKDYIFVCTFK